jgi:hypothetical protein
VLQRDLADDLQTIFPRYKLRAGNFKTIYEERGGQTIRKSEIFLIVFSALWIAAHEPQRYRDCHATFPLEIGARRERRDIDAEPL